MSKRGTFGRNTPASTSSDLGGFSAEIFGFAGPRNIPIAEIVVNDQLQLRVDGNNSEWVAAIVDALEAGTAIEPISLFEDDAGYILGDGFHRLSAYIQLEKETIPAIVKKGGFAAALECAMSANLTHGLPLTMDDKRNIFTIAHQQGIGWALEGVRPIAKRLGVNPATISRWRELVTEGGGVANATPSTGKKTSATLSPQKAAQKAMGWLRMLTRPAYLEPLSGIDGNEREQIKEMLLKIWDEIGGDNE